MRFNITADGKEVTDLTGVTAKLVEEKSNTDRGTEDITLIVKNDEAKKTVATIDAYLLPTTSTNGSLVLNLNGKKYLTSIADNKWEVGLNYVYDIPVGGVPIILADFAKRGRYETVLPDGDTWTIHDSGAPTTADFSALKERLLGLGMTRAINLVFPNLTKFPDNALDGELNVLNNALKSFDAPKLIEIGNSAFSHCSGLTGTLTIPNGVTTIGVSAFQGCYGFTGTLSIPNSVTTIGELAFSSCSGFSGALTIPNSVITIGEWAFAFCHGFSGALSIPNSVTKIGNSAFYSCSGFTSNLTIPNSVTEIGYYAFYECSGFAGTLTISNSITKISNSVFFGCSGLTGTLTIPNGVTTIGVSAFQGCYGFTGTLTIPNSVTAIGETAFVSCYDLSAIVVNWTSNPPSVMNATFPSKFKLNQSKYITIPAGTHSEYQKVTGWSFYDLR